MKNKIKLVKILGISITFLILLSSLAVSGIEINIEKDDSETITSLNSSDSNTYDGRLRVYIVEIESRWNMYDGNPYHFAAIDLVDNKAISIDYMDTLEQSYTWTDETVDMDNIMVIAAVYNGESEIKYSNPRDNKLPFNGHYIDASAGASPGESDSNVRVNGFTHTVLIEKATDVGCWGCPIVGDKLNELYEENELPFYFISLVANKNDVAKSRLGRNGFNIWGYPSAYYDGGKVLLMGSSHEKTVFRNFIDSCAKSDVHELDLLLSVALTSENNISISISITNVEELTRPFKPLRVSGETSVKKDKLYEYSTVATDPNEKQLYYKWDWGDGTYSDWIGPFNSGEQLTVENSWSQDGPFQVRVKAKNTDGIESLWADPQEVKLSNSFNFLNPFINFFAFIISLIKNLFNI